MKSIFTLVFAFSISFFQAQTVADFENYDLSDISFLNGSDGNGGFSSGNIFLPNEYTLSNYGDFWSGWVISSERDTTTPGFLNQYSAIAGSGAESSSNYAITFASAGSNLILQNEAAGKTVKGLYVTNSTYAYLSMRDGDSFAKKFGGLAGDEPDFFLLTIKKYLDGELSTDSIDFYLADFRFEEHTEDYIIDDWSYIDLSVLGNADSLQFSLSSSDVGQFGMNTPAYLCIDNVITNDQISSTKQLKAELNISIFPNPTNDYLNFEWLGHQGIVQILSVNGQLLLEQNLVKGNNQIDVSKLNKALYLLQFRTKEGSLEKLFVKN